MLEGEYILKHCKICKNDLDLKESHIIPSFIGKWLKETSGTGFLTVLGVDKEAQRSQDLTKLPLFCGKCEGAFSAYETYVANNLFHPFNAKKLKTISMDDRIAKFVISVSLRVAIFLNEIKDEKALRWQNTLIPLIDEWKAYLFSNKQPAVIDNSHYLLFGIDRLLSPGLLAGHDDIILNITRSCAFYIYEFNNSAYLFVNMAGFQIISMLTPKVMPVEKGCKVYPTQTLGNSKLSGVGWGGYFQNIIAFNGDINSAKKA